MTPRAAYIHVPFCRHRCGYCNFTVIAGRDDLAEAYLAALALELNALGSAHEVDTIFLGGGTPTHLTLAQLERLLQLVQQSFPLAAGGEFSVEANPRDALETNKLALLRGYGVTRISLGAQSFSDAKLRLLERDHDAGIIRQTVLNCRAQGFDVSLDLIFGAPGETLANWRQDLQDAIALAPDHLSTYGLTFEKGTAFWSRLTHGQLLAADEATERELYVSAMDTLVSAGFEHYEVSNFARPGHRCRHNETYWLGREYFAAGPGASRYVDRRRETNHRSTTTWLQRVRSGQSPVAESEEISAEEQARERLVFGLRRLEGILVSTWESNCGMTLDALAGPALARFIAEGWLERRGDRLKLTREGLLISDALWPDLLG
jgi:oxygen-independent coproporphyrinogen-3 oxidase